MNDLKERVLQFLYKQVEDNKIPNIRKGMVEDFEGFVLAELARVESNKLAARLEQAVAKAEGKDETNPQS